MEQATKIRIEKTANASLSKVWEVWNNPADIIQWNSADPSWHCPGSENDLRTGGTFKHRMEARDGSFGFDFGGIYDKVDVEKEISYTMGDKRQVRTLFSEKNGSTTIETVFDAESENDPEMQKQGWQAILDNFVKYVESRDQSTKKM